MLYNTRRTGTPPGSTENLLQSSTRSLGMGAAIKRTYKNGLWHGRSHPAEETINNDKVWSQPSMKTQVWAQPSINESCNDYPQKSQPGPQ